MPNFDLDDKSLVVICVTVICLVSMWAVPDATTIISNALTGLFGVAVGKALPK